MKFFSARSAVLVFALGCGTLSVFAQSTDQNFPSPVTTSEISGTIKVRDIGDSRVTSYFYAFDGGQGDIFINVVTKNFSGDIDIFAADDMRPLTKMVIYADSAQQETGRLIYLRKNERLMLRVEGRSPNDDPASFRIKFGGSFIALAPEKTVAEPTVASTEPNESGVRVNSVGTIVAVAPKPTPTRVGSRESRVGSRESPPKTEGQKPKTKDPKPGAQVAKRRTKPAPKPTSKPKAESRPVGTPADGKPKKPDTDTVFENETAKVIVEQPKSEPSKPEEPKPKVEDPKPKTEDLNPNPLASIWLVIELKDGNTIRRPMSEVTKFNVEKGTLVVTAKNGKIVRYRILEVAKVTIQ